MRFSRGRVLLVLAGVAIAAVVVLLLFPREVPPEEQVRRNVVKMARAAQEKDIAGITAYVSESFKGQGGLTRDNVKGLLLHEVLKGQWTRVFVVGMDAQAVSSSEVQFSGRFLLGRSDAEKLSDLARESVIEAFVIEGTAVKEADGEFRFTTAKHRRATPDELLP